MHLVFNGATISRVIITKTTGQAAGSRGVGVLSSFFARGALCRQARTGPPKLEAELRTQLRTRTGVRFATLCCASCILVAMCSKKRGRSWVSVW